MAVTSVAVVAVVLSSAFDRPSQLRTIYDNSVYMVGDSLTVGTAPNMPSALRGRVVKIDAFPGIVIWQADQMIEDELRHPPLPPTVVVAVGGNDREPLDQFAAWVEHTIRMLGSSRIIWVNFAGAVSRQKNHVLATVASHHSNVKVLNWFAVIAQHPEDVGPDGVHYTAAGYRLRAKTIAAAVGR
jgi:lysophospholipase L1-like esterase